MHKFLLFVSKLIMIATYVTTFYLLLMWILHYNCIVAATVSLSTI